MPTRLNPPNILIYLGALFRPSQLRPHLRVPSIAQVDFRALRNAGFNAVVIDKDNCVTLPDSDDVYPPLQAAWTRLLSTFEPGRVLLVSNSAGTKRKDPDSIAAEAVSLSLRCPVLLHPQPKPGCANLIIQYFAGSLGAPTTLRAKIAREAQAVRQQEEEDEKYMIEHLEALVSGPLLGPLVDENGKEVDVDSQKAGRKRRDESDGHHLEHRMSTRQREASAKKVQEKEAEKAAVNAGDGPKAKEERTKESLRILVIGDRLFTDTLLANRLAKLLASPTISKSKKGESSPPSPPIPSPSSSQSSSSAVPSVISIHTTLLPQPKDVRLLRWLEHRLSKGRIRTGTTDWGRYILDPTPLAPVPAPLTWQERLNPFRNTPPLTFHPRSWRPAPLAVGLGRGLYWVSSRLGRGLIVVLQRAWAGEVEVAKVLAAKARGEEKKVELAVSELEVASKEASGKTIT